MAILLRAHASKASQHSTHDLMFHLIPLVAEIKVVVDGVIATFVETSQDDRHFELAPSSLFDAKWRLLDS